MGLLNRKKQAEPLPPLWSEQELQELGQVDYNSVLEYLQGLSDKDYAALIKVAEIYRNANEKAAAALGIAVEPTTHIHPPVPPADPILQRASSFLDDEPDTEAGSFLDDHDTPASKSQRTTAKKATTRKIDVSDKK